MFPEDNLKRELDDMKSTLVAPDTALLHREVARRSRVRHNRKAAVGLFAGAVAAVGLGSLYLADEKTEQIVVSEAPMVDEVLPVAESEEEIATTAALNETRPNIVINGVVEVSDGCFSLRSESSSTTPLAWPDGTTWQEPGQSVVLPDSTVIELGQPVEIIAARIDNTSDLWDEIRRQPLGPCDVSGLVDVLLVLGDQQPATAAEELLMTDTLSISELNDAVMEFLSGRLAEDNIRIEYSVGISIEVDRDSPKVVVGIPAETRQRSDVALVEEDLQRFVESLVGQASNNMSVDELFEVQATTGIDIGHG